LKAIDPDMDYIIGIVMWMEKLIGMPGWLNFIYLNLVEIYGYSSAMSHALD